MAERKTIYKLWFVWDYDKEEKWLNEMSREGWALVDVGFNRFTFEKCEPEEYIIRLEMRDTDNDYISFMESTGAEYIGRCLRWHYFRRKSELGGFDIMSDLDSKLDHLSRIYKMLIAVGMLNLFIGILNSLNLGRFGWVNLICSTVIMYGAGRIKGRIDYLENERMLRE